jgi:hypothetical protein
MAATWVSLGGKQIAFILSTSWIDRPINPLVQGFSSVTERVTAGSTVWGVSHLPQNREVFMVSSGDGTLHLYKYHYPDQRRIKVSGMNITRLNIKVPLP